MSPIGTLLVERAAAKLFEVIPQKNMSLGLRTLAGIKLPQPVLRSVISKYEKIYGVDLSEAEVPSEGFKTLDEFFTRKLKANARHIDADIHTLISPADGRLEAAGPLVSGTRFEVKGQTYTVDELVPGWHDLNDFKDGSMALVYLAPGSYHRVHAPVSGKVTRVKRYAGKLYPVNRIGAMHIPKVFVRNERVAVEQSFHYKGQNHRVLTVMVAAFGVGNIEVSFDQTFQEQRTLEMDRSYPQAVPHLTKGDELGVFHLGSTVVLLTSLPTHAVGDGVVHVGEPLGRFDEASRPTG